MNKKRLNELKAILREAISVISEATEEELASVGMEPKTNRDSGFDPSATGEFSKEQILDKLKELYENMENDDPNLERIVATLNSPELATGFGMATLANGDGASDAVSVSPGSFPISKGAPTQSQIFLKKSAAYPLSSWASAAEQFDNKVKDNPYLQISFSMIGEKAFILDGHHRWSGAFCFGDPASCEIGGTNFQFASGSKLNKILANLQVAIKILIGEGQPMPFATGGDSGGMDVYNMSTQDLIDGLMGFIGKPGTALDKKAPSSLVLDVEWFKGAQNHAGFKAWCEAGLSEYKSQLNIDEEATFDTLLAEILSETGQEDQGVLNSKKLRQLIITKVCNAYTSLPAADDAPERQYMPQLGGTDATPVPGKEEAVQNVLSGGEANIEKSYDYPEVNESIDLTRWNKLAGILKD
tara:strand:- start:8664 stop:9902 length:1239 start_codon:yes stop_codon:yes gene_type:complete